MPVKRRGWPSVSTLDGVYIYHNNRCIEQAKQMTTDYRANLPELTMDKTIPNKYNQFYRRACGKLSNVLYPIFSFVGNMLKNTEGHCEKHHTKHHTRRQVEYGGLYLIYCKKCGIVFTRRS
jgi:hypothetical protein